MKLYLIQENEDERVFFQTTRKRDAQRKLNELKRNGIENLSIEIDNDPFVVFLENGGCFYYTDYDKKSAAFELAKKLSEERKIDVSVGIKDYLKSDGSFELDKYDYNVIPI